MADEPLNAEPTPTDPPAEPSNPPADPAPVDPAPADPAPVLGSPAEPEPQPVEATWPTEWKTLMSGEDEALGKLVGRYNEPQALAKALQAANAKISAGELVKPLGDNPSEDELKSWREGNGIPLEAAGYEVEWRDGFTPEADEDKALVGEFLNTAHAQNMQPEAVQDIVNWYQDTLELSAQNIAAQADEAHRQTEDQLAIDWGEHKQANLDLAKGWLDENLKKHGSNLDEFRTMRLEDGSFVGDYLPFIKLAADMARYEAGTDDFAAIGGMQSGQGLDAQIDELMELRVSDQAKYLSPEVQEKLGSLFAMKERRESAAQ